MPHSFTGKLWVIQEQGTSLLDDILHSQTGCLLSVSCRDCVINLELAAFWFLTNGLSRHLGQLFPGTPKASWSERWVVPVTFQFSPSTAKRRFMPRSSLMSVLDGRLLGFPTCKQQPHVFRENDLHSRLKGTSKQDGLSSAPVFSKSSRNDFLLSASITDLKTQH